MDKGGWAWLAPLALGSVVALVAFLGFRTGLEIAVDGSGMTLRAFGKGTRHVRVTSIVAVGPAPPGLPLAAFAGPLALPVVSGWELASGVGLLVTTAQGMLRVGTKRPDELAQALERLSAQARAEAA